jgi:hypothetical protein
MQRSNLLVFAALFTGAVQIQAQGLLQTITTPDKAVPVVNQALSGTWLSELRRPGPSGLQASIPAIVTFSSDGTWIASPSDGNQTATQGLWIRVGDRKFLGTGYFFSFDVSRVLTTIAKLRINYQVSTDGKTLTGTTEAVVLDGDGKVISTFPGATFTMVRLSPEIPGDFYDFQKVQ